MITLNLVHPDKSDIKYKIQKFPDGQQNIVIENLEKELVWADWHSVGGGSIKKWAYPAIQIKSRLNNWLDLELIVCVVASLREMGIQEISLYTPYIMGARSDRKFEEGGNNYLRDVICPVINSLNFKTVTCIDPHSDVLEACIKGFRKESNLRLVNHFREDYAVNHQISATNSLNNCILVSPDAGASKKIYKLAEQIGYKGDIITCSKDRDTEGKLTRTVVPITIHGGLGNINYYMSRDYIIIDDICDGGATFINITKELKNQGVTGKIYLIITHGIFSSGFEELSKYFDGIYCTNSYSNIGDYVGMKAQKTNVKQLNVF